MKTQTIRLQPHTFAFDAAQLPPKIQVLPLGTVEAIDGRTFTVDAQAVLKTFAKRKVDLPIDINHSTENAAPYGRPSPAVGWGNALSIEADGIYASVDWNKTGRAALSDREYRYLSPAVIYDMDAYTATKQLVVSGLTSIALVNTPALNQLPALASEQPSATIAEQPNLNQEEQMKRIAALFGLNENVSVDALYSVLAEHKGKLDLAATNAAKLQADYDKLNTTYSALQTEHTKLQAQTKAAAVAAVVDQAIADGKITPASRNYHLQNAMADLEGFKAYAAAQPKVIADQSASAANPATSTSLTAVEQEAARLLGLDLTTYAAKKAAQMKVA